MEYVQANKKGQAAGRDVVNKSSISNVFVFQGSEIENQKEPLSRSRRIHLNDLVEEISRKCRMDRAKVWVEIHRSTGVDSIGQMDASHYELAKRCLLEIDESYKNKKAQKRLIAFLMAMPDIKRKEAETCCLLHYGTTQFRELNQEQLRFIAREIQPKASLSLKYCEACQEKNKKIMAIQKRLNSAYAMCIFIAVLSLIIVFSIK